jgi:hypothetical protein
MYNLRGMRCIVTHRCPHLDELFVIWLAIRFAGLLANLPIKFVNDLEELIRIVLPEFHWPVGIGGENFDEHGRQGRKRSESAVSKALRNFGLTLENLPFLKAVADAVHLGDTRGEQHASHLDALLNLFMKLYPHDEDVHRKLIADILVALDALVNSWGQLSETDYAAADELYKLIFPVEGSQLPKHIRKQLNNNWVADKKNGVVLGSPLHIRTVIAALLKHGQTEVAKRMMTALLGAFVTRSQMLNRRPRYYQTFRTRTGLLVAIVSVDHPFGMTQMRQRRNQLMSARQKADTDQAVEVANEEALPDIVIMKTTWADRQSISVMSHSARGAAKLEAVASQIAAAEYWAVNDTRSGLDEFMREVMAVVHSGTSNTLPGMAEGWYLQRMNHDDQKEDWGLLHGTLTRDPLCPTNIVTEDHWVQTLSGI